MTLAPGSTIGIIGGGQLGRMLAIAAARIGYRCHIFDPHEAPCAAEVSAWFTRAAFTDQAALAAFAAACDVVTYEFENLPVASLSAIGDKLLPSARSLEIAQDRAAEKTFLEGLCIAIAAWRTIDSPADIAAACEALGTPLLVKTRRLGYDGKGQAWVRDPAQAADAWRAIGGQPAVAEAEVRFDAEFSVVLARAADGSTRAFPISRNEHEAGILRRSFVPAGDLVGAQSALAIAQAKRIAAALGHVGVMTVEYFACQGGPLVNEIAPRVHNSGHWTIDGAATSQFEQHVRAICGLPLGDPAPVTASAVMTNLIGTDIDRWPEILADPGARLHHYAKGEARPGRKMGHVTRLG